jgi:hypothetical protein
VIENRLMNKKQKGNRKINQTSLVRIKKIKRKKKNKRTKNN